MLNPLNEIMDYFLGCVFAYLKCLHNYEKEYIYRTTALNFFKLIVLARFYRVNLIGWFRRLETKEH